MAAGITHTFHVVDELPFRGSILTVDCEGTIHTYVSLAVPVEDRWADLGWVFTSLAATGDYARTDLAV
jgi:hypothetical protein